MPYPEDVQYVIVTHHVAARVARQTVILIRTAVIMAVKQGQDQGVNQTAQTRANLVAALGPNLVEENPIAQSQNLVEASLTAQGPNQARASLTAQGLNQARVGPTALGPDQARAGLVAIPHAEEESFPHSGQ